MSTAINSITSSQSASAELDVQTVQAVQTNLEDGTWMYLDAATNALGLSEKTIRRYVQKNKLQHRRLGRQTNSPLQVWITREFLNSQSRQAQTEKDYFDVGTWDVETVDVQAIDLDCSPAISDENALPTEPVQKTATGNFGQSGNTDLETVVRTMATQFADKLDQQKELVFELRKELEEKSIQLRLLPDLQKKLEDQEKLAYVHSIALEKQVEALLSENEKLRLELATPKVKQSWWNWFMGRTPAE